ncbi:hypothetical protein SAMN02744133_101440 [Thalassospira xiamenensis M-5 = DSM 17429]|nr:hypothetical protein SAMN02744133_101440 [Thalassospira xiamenensis M-5 = DSM 17429]
MPEEMNLKLTLQNTGYRTSAFNQSGTANRLEIGPAPSSGRQ